MRRVVPAALCVLVPVLAACGGSDEDRPSARPSAGTTVRPDGPATTTGEGGTTTSVPRNAPLELAMPRPTPGNVGGVDDPCEGTKRARIKRDHGIGRCVDDVADRVVGRRATLRLSGMTVRLRGLTYRPTVPAADGSGEVRPTDPGSRFAFARLTIENRRPTRVTLKRGAVGLDLRATNGPTRLWAPAGADGSAGKDRDVIRFAPGATRTVIAAWERPRTGPTASDVGARISLTLPDPPGTPKHGPGKRPGFTYRLGVFRLAG